MKTFLEIISDPANILWLGIAIVLFIGVKLLLKTLGDGFGNTSAPNPSRLQPRTPPLAPPGRSNPCCRP